MSEYKRIGGVTYRIGHIIASHKDAERYAKEYRDNGYTARIIKKRNIYGDNSYIIYYVYYRTKIKRSKK
jgi:hypothetical protein